MSRLRSVVALLALMFVSMSVLAAEVVDAGEAVWYGNVQLWELVGTVAVFIWGIVKIKYGLEARLTKQVTEFIEMGAQKTYDDWIRKFKEGGGKLSAEQIKKAQGETWESAKAFAKAKGLDLAKKVAAERLPSLISGIVKRMKKK